jgi:hypothetical protein
MSVPDRAAPADARLTIPMVVGVRSLNIATAAAMMLGEALRQTGGFLRAANDGDYRLGTRDAAARKAYAALRSG